MTDKTDFIKEAAEKELGHKIPDEAWTREARDFYKIYLHGRNYGFGGRFGMILPIENKEIKE